LAEASCTSALYCRASKLKRPRPASFLKSGQAAAAGASADPCAGVNPRTVLVLVLQQRDRRVAAPVAHALEVALNHQGKATRRPKTKRGWRKRISEAELGVQHRVAWKSFTFKIARWLCGPACPSA
jgi:hypothetical protein